ncbi:MAG: hypothetical protein HY693_01015 [Deltaproteobacteria bacterium]|nr:hypothetical protein [Deltaproteobacteria bacterium]
MKKLIVSLLFLISCAGGSYTATQNEKGFNPRDCLNIPVGIERLQYIDPSLKKRKISCATLARCATLMGQGAPSNVPCERQSE